MIKGLDEPYEQVIEAALAAGGDQAILVLEERGMPLDSWLAAATGAGIQVRTSRGSRRPPGTAA